jgi:integrase
MREEIDRLCVVDGTRKHYVGLVKRLEEFDIIHDWKDVSVENIYKLDGWLRKMNGRCGKITGGAVYNYHKCLRSLLGRAERSELIPFNPYSRLRGVFSKGDRENTEYLTEDEMKAFVDLKVPEGQLSLAHDLFVFQMYTGLSFSDMQAFDFSKYRKVGDTWQHTGERIKTGVAFVSQLLPPVVRVLEKYGFRIPKIDNADYNHQLKALGVMAGIQTPLHSHLARHTFATWMLNNGAKIENVSKMLGHTNITQTQRYAKVIAQSVHDDFERVAEKLK